MNVGSNRKPARKGFTLIDMTGVLAMIADSGFDADPEDLRGH